jgi:hypothetical protein
MTRELPRLHYLAQAAIELQHIGNVLEDLVAGAVAANDDVSGGHEGASCERCNCKFSGEGRGWLLGFGGTVAQNKFGLLCDLFESTVAEPNIMGGCFVHRRLP